MPLPLGSESGRRLLIAAGTAHFKELADSDLSRVPEELERIAATFARLGYERQQTAFSSDPESGQLRTLFADAKKESRAEDLVVAYYTSHGARDPEQFYLLARNSTLSDLDGTALSAGDLARALTKDSKASQVLVILDACYAGAGAAEFAQVSNRLAALLAGGPAVFVVAAARPKQEAEQGALSSALAEALANDNERLGGRAQPFLTMDDVMEAVHSYLGQKHPAQTATWSSANVSGRCRLFPNPCHQPAVRPGLDLETQRAFTEHWEPKARGADLGAGGWYFTGRKQALTELAAWLSAERSDGRSRVVTGGPGCGKSSVLARVVTLADPTYRREVLSATRSASLDPATLPPEGVVNVAVHARRKLLADVAAQIAADLGLAMRDSVELLAALARRPEKTVIVVDALDEADGKDEIASRLLRPLAELPQIFLLVGTRPDSSEHGRRFRALGDTTMEIDLDHPRYVGTDDVARYVERRLLAAEEPRRQTHYRESPETARTVARAVAERARGVFLVAHTAVHALLAATSIMDVTQPGWIERLPTGLDDAFAQFLAELDTRRPGGLSSAKARAVLLPLAFAEGEGLPWVDLWAATATGLSVSTISDADITLVRDHAAPFIVEAIEQDRSVYRLYHERLTELLRGSVADSYEAQRRIVEALRSRVPETSSARRPDWTRAHPYVLGHLATHALKAGTLGDLVTDGMFLAAGDPIRVLQVLSVSTDPLVRRAYACYSLAFDRDQSADERLSYLEMTARQQADNELAEMWERDGLPRPWRVPWARFAPIIPHRTIFLFEWVKSIALGTLDERPIIMTGGGNGTIRLWDLASGTQRSGPLFGHDGEVNSIALGTVDGRSIIVSGGRDGTVRVWDLASGAQRGEPLRGHDSGANSVALGTLDGRPIIVSGGEDGTVRVWDLASGTQRGEPLCGHDGSVNSAALGAVDGRPVIASAGKDGTVRVWDLASGSQRGKPLRGHGVPKGIVMRLAAFASGAGRAELRTGPSSGVRSVALGALGGRPVIVSGGDDGTVRVWDLATGAQRGEPLRGHKDNVSSLALGTVDRQPVIVSGGSDGTVRVWDLASRRPYGEPLCGHNTTVRAVVMGTFDGRSVIVSSGGAMEVWDLAPDAQRRGPLHGRERLVKRVRELVSGAPHKDENCLRSLAVGILDGRSVIISGGNDGMVRMWDLASGTPLGEPLNCRRGFVWRSSEIFSEPYIDDEYVCSIALGTLNGGPVIVFGASDGTIWVWDDPASRRPHTKSFRGHYCGGATVALATLDGRPVMVSGGAFDQKVKVWDLASRSQQDLAQPLKRVTSTGGEGVLSLALGLLDSRPVIVSGELNGELVRVWDLASGMLQRSMPKLHDGPVQSVAVGMLDGPPVIVSGGWDGRVYVRDLASGSQRCESLRCGGRVNSVALGALDGQPVIVSGGTRGTVRVWDACGVLVSSVFVGGQVNALAFAESGTIVVATDRGLLPLQFESGA